jgi:hypothetical protein
VVTKEELDRQHEQDLEELAEENRKLNIKKIPVKKVPLTPGEI